MKKGLIDLLLESQDEITIDEDQLRIEAQELLRVVIDFANESPAFLESLKPFVVSDVEHLKIPERSISIPEFWDSYEEGLVYFYIRSSKIDRIHDSFSFKKIYDIRPDAYLVSRIRALIIETLEYLMKGHIPGYFLQFKGMENFKYLIVRNEETDRLVKGDKAFEKGFGRLHLEGMIRVRSRREIPIKGKLVEAQFHHVDGMRATSVKWDEIPWKAKECFVSIDPIDDIERIASHFMLKLLRIYERLLDKYNGDLSWNWNIGKCDECHNFYIRWVRRDNRKYCSDKCRYKWHNRRRIESGEAKEYKRKRYWEGKDQ